MTSLKVEIAGVKMPNPTMLASGIMGETAGSLIRVAQAGAGALVTKSIGLEPRKGYANPTLVELEDGYINAMGLPGPGMEAFSMELAAASAVKVPIIGSVFAATPDDFASLARRMQEAGASAVELNLSCPHAQGYGMEVGVDPDAVRRIVTATKDACTVPIFAKLTPNTHRLIEVGRAVEQGGGDAVVAINTLKAMRISVETRRPVLSNRSGGLSGPAVRAVGVRCVYDLHSALSIPIIGAGGVEDWRSAAEYIMAGASSVQIGSGIGRRGLAVFGEVCAGLESFMSDQGFTTIKSMVGAAHE